MKHLLLAYLLFQSLFSYSQREANNWYFGEYAGITFETGEPTAILNSALPPALPGQQQ